MGCDFVIIDNEYWYFILFQKYFYRIKFNISPNVVRGRELIMILSGVYVLGCGFRSFLPMIDLERVCLVDTWLSNMLVGRSVATLAELAFIAEGFSWYAVITTNYFGSVVEESIWMMAGMLLFVSFTSLWKTATSMQRYFYASMMMFSVGFIAFMLTVDIPMYWHRWSLDVAAGKEYLSLGEGLLDTSKRYVVNFNMALWQHEIPWMTLYFTIAVWLSIYLAHAPSFTKFEIQNN